MIKKIFFQSIFFNFFFLREVFAAESGGMPQLNPEFWVSQIFWLIITFGILYIVLSKFILPKISSNLELRKSQIQENIETAEKQREISEVKLKEINLKKETLDKQIDDEISNAEEEIKTLKKDATDKINKIAIETSSDLLKKLIGTEINNSSISAIVDDLSKKNKDKYYGS